MIDQGWQHFLYMARERRRQYRAVEHAFGLRPEWSWHDWAAIGAALTAVATLLVLAGCVP